MQSSTGDERFIGSYWIRQGAGPTAKTWRLARVNPIENESTTQQFIAYLLQSDSERASAALAKIQTDQSTDQLIKEIAVSGLGAHIHDTVLLLSLQEACAALHSSNGPNFLDFLSMQSAWLTADFDRSNNEFMSLLEAFGGLRNDVVWLKGTVLGRTVYQDPRHRPSGDFDIVIRPEMIEPIFAATKSLGYQLSWLGPPSLDSSSSFQRLAMGPCQETKYTDEISAFSPGRSMLEIKFDPLKSGLKMKELTRFFSDTKIYEWNHQSFRGPSVEDHLMIVLFNMHRRSFHKLWPWLYDIHLLASCFNDQQWQQLVTRCRTEGIEISAWAGLDLAKNRLKTKVPDEVMRQLAPKRPIPGRKLFTFVVGSRFVWHEKGILGLVANLLLLGDKRRKLNVLKNCICPSQEFLRDYYNGGQPLGFLGSLRCLQYHWSLLLKPRAHIKTELK